jgi:hypothetical protein
MAAMDKEWKKLEDQTAWLLDKVREWKDVSAEAKSQNRTVHVGRVFGILVEKGSELPKGHPERKFKGRVVFQGNQVRDQSGDWALFEELSSAPATMEAGKAVDAYGCASGNTTQQAGRVTAIQYALRVWHFMIILTLVIIGKSSAISTFLVKAFCLSLIGAVYIGTLI